MRILLFKIGLIGIIVCLLSLGIDALYRHTYNLRYQQPPRIFALPEIEEKYELVSLGNSHAQDGLTFERYRVKSLELSSVAQSFEYDLAHLKMTNKQIKPGAVILIGISPISFSQKISDREDSLQTKYYDGRLSPFLIPNLKVGDYLQSQVFPFLRAGYLWREKHNQQIIDLVAAGLKDPSIASTAATLSEQGLPGTPFTIKPEDQYFNVDYINSELTMPVASPTAQFKESASLIVNKWNNQDAFNQRYFEANIKDLIQLLDYCNKKSWRPVLVTVPITQHLLDSLQADYLHEYMYDNLNTIDLSGIDYFDFSAFKAISQNYDLFNNSDHLNSRGAAAFSYILLQQLIDKGYLIKEVDAYDYRPYDSLFSL